MAEEIENVNEEDKEVLPIEVKVISNPEVKEKEEDDASEYLELKVTKEEIEEIDDGTNT